MNIVGTISEILRQKGSSIWSISEDTTVFDAIRTMAERNIGAVLVMSGDRLVGLISERDYTRKVALKGKSSKSTHVKEIMARELVTVTPDETVEDCLRLMTNHRVRHLPVVDNGRVLGIVSIGDLVNWIISVQSATIDQLENYIAGHYPG